MFSTSSAFFSDEYFPMSNVSYVSEQMTLTSPSISMISIAGKLSKLINLHLFWLLINILYPPYPITLTRNVFCSLAVSFFRMLSSGIRSSILVFMILSRVLLSTFSVSVLMFEV